MCSAGRFACPGSDAANRRPQGEDGSGKRDQNSDLIFIAEVLEAIEIPRADAQGRPLPEGITNYRFDVLEGLKGIEPGEFPAQFSFGAGQDLNSFRRGHRYLIFATRTTTGIYRSGCSPTHEITTTGEREWLPKLRTELGLCLKPR